MGVTGPCACKPQRSIAGCACWIAPWRVSRRSTGAGSIGTTPISFTGLGLDNAVRSTGPSYPPCRALIGAQGTNPQLGISIDSDRQVAAANAPADNQRTVFQDFEPAPSVCTRQRAARAHDWSSVGECDLAA